MLKKIFTLILLFSSLFFYLKTYGATYEEEFGGLQQNLKEAYVGNEAKDSDLSDKLIGDLKESQEGKELLINNFGTESPTAEDIKEFQKKNGIKVDGIIGVQTLSKMKGNIVNKIEGKLDINTEYFMINVNDFSPGGNKLIKNNAKKTLNATLGTFIQKMMIALGSLALLIMTIGSGYMILYGGQDELLSKGKTIFTSGIISLVVALTGYYLVSLIRFLLYA